MVLREVRGMSLITMAVYDTEENGRTEYTRRTIESLKRTVDWKSGSHQLIIVDNNSCAETKKLISEVVLDCILTPSGLNPIKPVIITLSENLGTSGALNLAWKDRKPGEHVIKIDNDVVIHQSGWVEQMEEAI